MGRAGRVGGVDAAREIVSVISSLNALGDEVSPEAIVSRMGKTPEEAEKFMDLLTYADMDGGLGLRPENEDGSGSYFASGAAGRPLRLTRAETMAVRAALAWMDTPEDDPLAKKVDEALGALDFDGDAVRRMLAPAGSPEVDAIRSECAYAIARKLDLRIVYRKLGATADEVRQVHDARLQQDDGSWYLVGLDLSRGAERDFKLERISSVEAVEPAGEVAKPASPASEPRQVTLTFDSQHWLELLPWHDLEVTRRADGTLTAKTPWYGGMWLPRMIASCGGHVTCDDPMLAAAVRGLAAAELGR